MLSRTRQGAAITAVLAVGVAGSVWAGGGSAAAMPGGCQHLVSASGKATSAYCSEGNGQFQAVAVCRDAERGATAYRYGTWREPGSQSVAYCQGVEYATDSGVNLRN
jgi:hypothetical protein